MGTDASLVSVADHLAKIASATCRHYGFEPDSSLHMAVAMYQSQREMCAAELLTGTPNPPDSTHCGLMPLAAGREAVGKAVIASVHITPQLLSALEAACKLLPREHRLELESLRVALLCQRMNGGAK